MAKFFLKIFFKLPEKSKFFENLPGKIEILLTRIHGTTPRFQTRFTPLVPTMQRSREIKIERQEQRQRQRQRGSFRIKRYNGQGQILEHYLHSNQKKAKRGLILSFEGL